MGVRLATNVGDSGCVGEACTPISSEQLPDTWQESRPPLDFPALSGTGFKYSAITGRTIFDLTFCFALLRCGHDVWYLRFSVAELQFFANRCCSVNVVLILNLSVYCPNTVLKFKNNSRHIGHSYCGNCLCDTVRLSGNSWVTWPRSVLT